jgi:DNA polymerase
VINLDFETYSEVDLRRVGVYAYAAHPSTRVELAAWALPGEAVQQWDINDCAFEDSELFRLFTEYDGLWAAWNAQFERVITRDVIGIGIPADRWRCTMQRAWALSFSGGLSEVGKQLNIRQDRQKLADGRKLVNKFCKPAPKNRKVGHRYNKENSPEDWARYREYNKQDVVAEREIAMLLPMLPDREEALYQFDQAVNDRGAPVDPELIHKCVALESREKSRIKHEMNEYTGLSNANSLQQLAPWLSDRGIEIPKSFSKAANAMKPSLSKDNIEAMLKAGVPDWAEYILRLRLQAGATSTQKWKAFRDCIAPDSRVHGMFQFGGAQRTQRWAGRLVQLHNLKQGYENADEVAEQILALDENTLRALYGDLLDVLANTVRTAITAPEGRMLAVCDLSAIESRMLGWLADCSGINDIFARKRDAYKAFAAEYYNKSEEEITKAERKFSKPPVLGCGYQLGGPGLVTYAEGYGVDLNEEEAKRLVDLWRSLYWEVPEMWYWLLEACKAVTETRHLVYEGYKVRIHGDERFLYIDLPSGRSLHYYHPRIEMLVPPWGGSPRPTMTYMGKDQYTNQWTRITTHGGKITENIDQACARDVLAEQMLHGWKNGLDIVAHVHDEMVAECDEGHAASTLSYMQELMSWTPPWAQGLLLGSAGFITKRYRKD